VFATIAGRQVRVYEWVDLRAPDSRLDPARVGAVVAAIHRVPATDLSPLDPWYHEPVGADRWDHLIEELVEAGAPFARRLADLRDELVALESWIEPPQLIQTCHRDLWADNVLPTPDGGVCVIDWEDSGPADPSQELACVLFEFARADPGRIRALTDAYRKPADRQPPAIARQARSARLVHATQQLADKCLGKPAFVPLGSPSPFQDQGAVDLGEHEREVDVDGVISTDIGRQVGGDALDVAAERSFTVGHDRLEVVGYVRVGAGSFLVDGDDVIHQLVLAALDVRGQPEALFRVGLCPGGGMAAVDIEGRGQAPGDSPQDLGFAAEGGVDRRRRDVGGLGDRGDRGGDVAVRGEQFAGGSGDLLLSGQCLALPVAGTRPLDNHPAMVSL
jgi:Phosphotransferase enzyme family